MQVKHIIKSRTIHQVTASVLYSLLKDAHAEKSPTTSLHEWILKMSKVSPTFKFWMMVLCLEVMLLSFIRAVRCGDFELYKKCIRSMLPWYFVFDHPNYSRWLSIQLQDLEELEVKSPDVYQQFKSGN